MYFIPEKVTIDEEVFGAGVMNRLKMTSGSELWLINFEDEDQRKY